MMTFHITEYLILPIMERYNEPASLLYECKQS